MHDPLTVAFDINILLPWKVKTFWKDGRKEWAKYHLATIWHKDPETDGSDDSCGWFIRSRHCNKETLAKIEKRFTEDWDRTFQSSRDDHDPDDGPRSGYVYACGLFKPDGNPNLSVQGIVLNLFFIAASEHFKSDGCSNWKKSKKWMSENLFDIMLFAENTHDSLFDGITRKFEIGCNEAHTPRRREERIRNVAGCIYSWMMRQQRPWYRHPRWHIHHWRVQIHFWQALKRWIFVRCAICGKGFRWRESVIGNWGGDKIWHDKCDKVNQKQ